MTKPIQIAIIQSCRTVETYFPNDQAEAREIYKQHIVNDYEYTQLTVGKRRYTTAQAMRFLQIGWGDVENEWSRRFLFSLPYEKKIENQDITGYNKSEKGF